MVNTIARIHAVLAFIFATFAITGDMIWIWSIL